MQVFSSALGKALRSGGVLPTTVRTPSARRWIFVAPDQLTDEVGPLAQLAPAHVGIVLLESDEWLRRRPYHRQKIATLLLHARAFAIEQAQRGVSVRYETTGGSIVDRLTALAQELGPLTMMEAAERELRAELEPLVRSGALTVVPNELWLTTEADFEHAREGTSAGRAGASSAEPPTWRMDRFYRAVRIRTGILMDEDRPVGGRFSFDGENRQRWEGTPEPPRPMRFRRSPLRDELEHEIHTRFSAHPGKLDLGAIPASKSDVAKLWQWALTECLPTFGPYEDAMSVRSRGLFHTRITPVLNIGRLRPRRVLDDVVAAELPLASKEGFIRQLIGWREFVRHVHRATDGFRTLAAPAAAPGDGGFERWKGRAWSRAEAPAGVDGGALPSALDATTPLPPAWWGRQSGLSCLDRVVADVWAEGWSHHITRLMILSNIATLLGVSPRELTDWFWVAYADAYDWVVEPNVLGMGTFAVGELMTTKPYVSGASYIASMSDYCGECAFQPGKDCPVTSLYWDFLRRNAEALEGNQRMRMPLASVRKRSEAQRERDSRIVVHVRDVLIRGERITPQGIRQITGAEGSAASDREQPESARADSLFP